MKVKFAKHLYCRLKSLFLNAIDEIS
jgi:hypothetical protein